MNHIPSEPINIQLIDNLIQVIRSLSLQEQMVLKSKLLNTPEASMSESTSQQSVIDILNETSSQQLLKAAEEVDRYLQQERASWDS